MRLRATMVGAVAAVALSSAAAVAVSDPQVERCAVERTGDRVRVTGFRAEDELALDYRGRAHRSGGVVVIERVRP